MPRTGPCPNCGGTGKRPGNENMPCNSCGGKGKVFLPDPGKHRKDKK